MTRLTVALLALALLAAPLAVEAQSAGKVPRIGVLSNSGPTTGTQIEAFRRGLRELGWIEGQSTPPQVSALIKELTALKRAVA